MLCCTFCGHDEERAMLLIAGPNHTAICDECVALCVTIIDEKNGAHIEYASWGVGFTA